MRVPQAFTAVSFLGKGIVLVVSYQVLAVLSVVPLVSFLSFRKGGNWFSLALLYFQTHRTVLF